MKDFSFDPIKSARRAESSVIPHKRADAGDNKLDHFGLMTEDLPGDASTSGTIAIGETLSGDGDEVGDTDWYRVELVSGLTYQLNLTGIDGFDPRLRLRDANGLVLEDHDDVNFPQNVNSVIVFEAQASGTYFIEALGPYNVGRYELTIVELEVPDDDYAGDITTIGNVDVGANVHGTAEVLDDQDWFAVELEAGQAYEFRADGIDGFDPILSLKDASGETLSVNDDIDYPIDVNSLLTYGIAVSGTYYVALEAPYVTGDYIVSVTSLGNIPDDYAGDATTTGVLSNGILQNGVFEVEGDTDWFKMSMEAGKSYSIFTLYDAGGFKSPDAVLYDADGTVLDTGFSSNDDNYFFYSADFTGDYYLGLTDASTSFDNYQIEFWEDDFADEPELIEDITSADATVQGAIEIGIDWDFFRLGLDEEKYYSLAFDADDFASLEFELTEYGPAIFGRTIARSASDPFVFKATNDSAILQVLSDGSETGGYAFSLSELAIVDDYGSKFVTAEAGVLGQAYEGSIEAAFDNDVFAYEFKEGVAYTIDLAPNAGALNEDFFIQILDADGVVIRSQSLFAFNGDTTAYFLAPDSSTYFVDVYTWDIDGYGDYTFSVSDDPIAISPVQSVNDLAAVEDNIITYYFADEGYEYTPSPTFFSDDYTGEEWSQAAKDAMRASMDIYESSINIQFVEVASASEVDFILVDDWDTNVGGFFGGPTTEFAGLGVFDLRAPESDPNLADSLNPGGAFFSVLTHELGHGLGLKHPHDTGPTMRGERMINVQSRSDLGLFNLNQSVFSVMSYNEDWQPPFNPVERAEFLDFGFQIGLGALDIAALGEKYGFNPEFALGDDLYVLADKNESGIGYQTIWDNGGTDGIEYNGEKDAVINLNDATLRYEIGGGGFVSFVDGVKAGLTIASGVVIENAISGGGNDQLIGNEKDNTLIGNEGDDVLSGGDGDDTLDGGSGTDTASYLLSDDGVCVSLGRHGDQNTKGAGRDRLIDIENLIGSDQDDTLTGNFGANLLSGEVGDDHLLGKSGDDILKGGAGEDILKGGWGNDVLLGGLGDDKLKGGFGNDRLEGGTGDDTLHGGSGADTFVFGIGDGRDAIKDFFLGFDRFWTAPDDIVELAFGGVASFEDVQDLASQVGNSTVLDFGNGDQLVFEHTDVSDLAEDHFAFA